MTSTYTNGILAFDGDKALQRGTQAEGPSVSADLGRGDAEPVVAEEGSSHFEGALYSGDAVLRVSRDGSGWQVEDERRRAHSPLSR
jgi:hypothetical protein